MDRVNKELIQNIYLDPGLDQVQPEGQSLPHEHVRVVTLIKSLLQFLQLPTSEIRARSSPLATGAIFVWIPRVWQQNEKE